MWNEEDNAQIKSNGVLFGCEAKCGILVDEECHHITVKNFHIINLSRFGFALLMKFRWILDLPIIRTYTYPKYYTEAPLLEIKRTTSSRDSEAEQ